jgi:hypothetical protein
VRDKIDPFSPLDFKGTPTESIHRSYTNAGSSKVIRSLQIRATRMLDCKTRMAKNQHAASARTNCAAWRKKAALARIVVVTGTIVRAQKTRAWMAPSLPLASSGQAILNSFSVLHSPAQQNRI